MDATLGRAATAIRQQYACLTLLLELPKRKGRTNVGISTGVSFY
jgi:hypothetical protein